MEFILFSEFKKKLLSKYNFLMYLIYKIQAEQDFIKNIFYHHQYGHHHETSLEPGQKKMNFDEEPVLNSMELN